MPFWNVALRMVLSLVIILVYIKLSANSQLAPMTASDQVGNIVIGALAGGTLTSDVSTWVLCAAIALWCGLQLAIRAVKYRSSAFSQLMDGRRVQLVKNGTLLTDNFDDTKLSPEDFMMNLHQEEINTLDDVKNVWLEPSGEMTIDKKGDELLSVIVVSNGSVVNDGLAALHKTEEWLQQTLEAEGYGSHKEVFMAEWHDGKFWVYPYQHHKGG